MALAIDTTVFTRHVEDFNDFFLEYCLRTGSFGRSWQIYRACALGTVIHDASSISRLDSDRPVARQGALDCQPDPDDELDEVEVFHHLNKLAKSSPVLEAAFSHTDRSIASTTVMTSCAFPPSSLPPKAQGRPLSSFHRYSFRLSSLVSPGTRHGYRSQSSDAVDDIVLHTWSRYDPFIFYAIPRLVGGQSDQSVLWQVQFDVVDFRRRRGHLLRRRRSTINPFLPVSAPRIQEVPPSKPHKETKQFKGVRFREDHKRWTAEMKPPTYKKKEYFGEFKSQTQAARVVDVAFHYYGKPLNFSDTPHILEERPIPANINDGDKLQFVKEQAKWASSIYSTLPFAPPSSGEVDGEGDDGTSQPQLSLHLQPTAGLVNNRLAEASQPEVAGVVSGVSVSNTLQEQQGLLEWSTSALSPWSPPSSMRIVDDGAEHSTALSSTNLRSPSEPSCDSHAQLDDEEQVMSGRMNAKRLRFTFSAHQVTPPSHQVAVAVSPWRACTSATPVFPATFSPCPSDRDADQGDHGMCEPQSWGQWEPMAGSTGPNRVGADGVDGVVTGTFQEQQFLSTVQNVENLSCSSLSSASNFIDIRDGEHPGALTSTNYGPNSSQFSSDSHRMSMAFLMMSPPTSIEPSSLTPFDYLPDREQFLWEQQGFGPDWISG